MKRTYILAILPILLLFISINQGYSQLNGTNTIDPAGTNFNADPGGVSGKNYTSLNNAVAALINYGISGAMIFNVASGTYNEQINIGLISGVSASQTITFQSVSLDSSSVIITYSASTNTDNFVVKLIGARYINFKAMTIRATGANYGSAVVIDSNTESSSFTNNCIQTTSNSSASVPIWFGTSINQYITLKNNLITGGYYGINVYGLSVAPYSMQNVVEGNIIRDFFYCGMRVKYQDGVKIRNNTLQNSTSSGNVYGMDVSYSNNDLEISGNNINLLNLNSSTTIYGINANNNTGTVILKGKIFNNFVAVGGIINSFHYGIYIYNCSYQEFSFNSVNMYASSTSSRCIYISNGSTVTLKDNIFANPGGGYTIYMGTTATLTASDYNDLYTSGTTIGYWTSNVANLAAWKTASGKDASSVSVNPGFYSQTDLHVNTPSISNLGTSFAGITNDIDGDTRMSPPDIGADEFTLAANDAGVSAFLSPLPPCPGSNAVSIKVKNYGTSVLNSVSVSWWVDGVFQGTSAYPLTSMSQNTDTVITVGIYVFSTGKSYNLKFKTILPNGVADPNPRNDSFVFNNLRTGLSGTYTIGAISSNYTSFTTAVNDLVQSGLCGSVVFRVRAGSYYENISIPKILGSSATKTITFESFNLDSNSVDLNYSSSGFNDNYTVQLSGASYVTFTLMKIRATGYDFGRAIVLTGGANYNSVLNSILYSYNGGVSQDCVCIYNDPNSLDNYNTIKNNMIQGGYYGIFFTGESTSARESFNIIQNNNIRDFAYTGILLYYQNSPIITANLIQNYYGSANCYGIHTHYAYDSLIITKNNILLNASSSNYGIYLSFSTNTVTMQSLILNNFISLTGNSTGNNYGIYLINTSNVNVLFNSVNVASPATANGRAFYINSGSFVTVKNNIFANFGSGYSMYVATPSAVTSSDYNDLYTNGAALGYWTADCANIAAWKTASGKDNFSVSDDPFFISPIDLHSYSIILDSAAQFSILVKDDIDNEIRNTTRPDIGADEFFVFYRDAGIVSLISPVSPCTSIPSNIVVKLRNYGIDTIKTIRIKWTINGVPFPAFNYPGKLAGTKETNIIIGTYTFYSGTTYNLKVWIDSINGSPDQNHKNDTLILKTIKTALSGAYTIGPSGRDFSSFTSAINDMKSFGVCDSVIFVVDSGTYNEQISIPPILGASKNHSITFQSAANDSNNSVISYAAQSSFDNYVVQLDGANYLRFKKIKMKSTSTGSYGYVLVLKNNASNNIFKNNVLQSIYVNGGSAACIYVQSGTQNDFNRFDNNRMYFGTYGINIRGPSLSFMGKLNIICNNIISNFYSNGIYSTYQDSIEISKNTIVSTSASSIFGISCYYNNNNSRIIGNNISLNVKGQSEGLLLSYCTGTKSSQLFVANNFVNISGTAIDPTYGINCFSGYYIKIYHNTINISAVDLTSSCLYFSSTSTGSYGNINVMNNIMTNTGGGYTINIDANAATLNHVSICNYNDLYVNGSYIGRYGATDISGLSTWQSTSGKDANSISVMPDYISATDLHLNNCNPFRVNNPLVDVTNDFDGEPRSTIRPVAGADENPCLPVNTGIMGIVSPFKVNCEGILPITGTLYNFGTTRLDSVYIDYYLNGIKKKTIQYKNPLLSLASVNVNISYDTFYAGNNYSVTLKTRLPNGINDPFPLDDGDSLLHIKVFPNPVVNLGHDTTLFDNQNITLDAGAGFDKYSWSTGNSIRTITVDTTGIGLHSKSFIVVVTKDGCTGSDTIVITFVKHIGIRPQSNFVINIYPNPSGAVLNVEISGISRKIMMMLTDIQGKELLNRPVVPANAMVKEEIDISGLPAGVYFLKISNEKMMKIEKVMKK